jgi:serine/threonine-protein kinase RsbT
MRDGFTTSGGLGLGLPGAKRLMDEFIVQTGASGTTITALKFMGSNA